MNFSAFNKGKYDAFWADLNRELSRFQSSDGNLTRIFEYLRAQQRDQGFIRDDLEAVEYFRFPHPRNSNRFFSVQYNPQRQHRFNGMGRMTPPPGQKAVNEGCFLCRENIRWQQNGSEVGYDVRIGETSYVVLMNAYPLMPIHAVIATDAHVPQAWRRNSTDRNGFEIRQIITDLAAWAERLPGYIGYYNGEGAGTSIPGHFHYQFFKRRDGDGRFPLELAPRSKLQSGHAVVTDYPVFAAYWRGRPKAVVPDALDWFNDWLEKSDGRIADPSMNLFATHRGRDCIDLYVVPRDQMQCRSPEMAGLIGGLEVLGELVFSTADEKRLLETGGINYHTVERILASVRVSGEGHS